MGQRGIPNHRLVTITGSTLQPSWAMVKNVYTLFKAPHAVRVRVLDDYYYNFNETAGTQYLGGSWKYSIDQNKAMLAVTWKGRVSLTEAGVIETESTGAHTGETGGTTLGLTASAYARASYVPGNFKSLQVTNSSGAAVIGAFTEMSFEIESIGEEDHLERPLHRKYKFTLKGRGYQTLKADRQAWNMDLAEDTTLLATLSNGDTIKINQAALDAEFIDGDDKREIAFECTGEVSANTADATPNSFDAGVTLATRLELTMVGAS